MSNIKLRKHLENFLRKKLVKGRVSEGNKKLDNLIGILFIAGIFLLVWEIFIYRRTIIDLKIPLIIWLTPGIILTPLLYNKMNNIDGMKAHWILHYILHSCMTGAFILFAFMSINFYFPHSDVEIKQFEIFETGSLSGSKKNRSKRKPYVVINYNGMEKQLIFPNSEMETVMKSEFVILELRKGRFGFEVLENFRVN